jgi:hypothetical protein
MQPQQNFPYTVSLLHVSTLLMLVSNNQLAKCISYSMLQSLVLKAGSSI